MKLNSYDKLLPFVGLLFTFDAFCMRNKKQRFQLGLISLLFHSAFTGHPISAESPLGDKGVVAVDGAATVIEADGAKYRPPSRC